MRALSEILLQKVLQLSLLAIAVYLAIAAYYGYAVGQAMHNVEASNPMIGIAATMVGRNAAERFAIHQSGVPKLDRACADILVGVAG